MSIRRQALLDGALLLGLLATVVAITHAYVTYERYFYFWDNAVYQAIAERTALAFRESLPAGWHALQRSFREDYNALFALPLVPWLLVFGFSRLSYELALALVYVLPLPLCWGAVAAQLMPTRAWAAFWVTAWLALLTPMTWVPALRGYPDAGAAALIALALCLYLRDVELADRMSGPAIGALLALSVLLRRHFAYAVLAFLAAAVLRALCVAVSRPGSVSVRVRRLSAQALRLGVVAAAGGAVALLLAGAYVERLIAFDFPALYKSYQEPLGVVVSWYFAPYGWATWMFAATGLLAGLASRRVERARLVFLLLFGALFALQWCWRVRQIGEQYTLHVTPFVVLGWLLLCIVTWERVAPPLARPLIAVVVGVGLVNLYLGLTYPDRSRDLLVRPLFAARWAPLVRFDYDSMLRLAASLRRDAQPEDSVYVAASSACLNPDILREADRIVARDSPVRLDVLSAPLVDSDAYYPLGELLHARYVVLARPFQHHLAAQEQDIVRAVYDMFDQRRDLAQDFAQLPESYALRGCGASVFERQRTTSVPVALASLQSLQTAVARPGMQTDWTVVASSHEQWLLRNPDGSTRWVAHAAPHAATPSTTMTALVALTDETRVEGTLTFSDARCQGVTLAFGLLRPDGTAGVLQELRRRPGEDGHFEAHLPTRAPGRLLLSVLDYGEGAPTSYCLVTLDALTLRPVTP